MSSWVNVHSNHCSACGLGRQLFDWPCNRVSWIHFAFYHGREDVKIVLQLMFHTAPAEQPMCWILCAWDVAHWLWSKKVMSVNHGVCINLHPLPRHDGNLAAVTLAMTIFMQVGRPLTPSIMLNPVSLENDVQIITDDSTRKLQPHSKNHMLDSLSDAVMVRSVSSSPTRARGGPVSLSQQSNDSHLNSTASVKLSIGGKSTKHSRAPEWLLVNGAGQGTAGNPHTDDLANDMLHMDASIIPDPLWDKKSTNRGSDNSRHGESPINISSNTHSRSSNTDDDAMSSESTAQRWEKSSFNVVGDGSVHNFHTNPSRVSSILDASKISLRAKVLSLNPSLHIHKSPQTVRGVQRLRSGAELIVVPPSILSTHT